MEKSKKRTKILISAILLGIFLIGAIVSIVLVLAASTQNVASNIIVSYNAEGVAAKVSANYAIVPLDTSASVTKTAMTTSGGGQEIVFNLSTSSSTETIAPSENIVLNPQNQTVVFEYVFENLADTAFSLSLSQRPTGTNMTERFLVTGIALDPSDYASAITGTSLAPQAVTYRGQKIYVYIMASVTNENLTASYNGGFAWNMVAQTKAAYSVTLNNGTGSTGGRTTLPVISTSTVSGIMMPSMSTLPSQSGKIFAGYYSAADGTGTQYYDGNGTPLTTAVTSATTLYAHYIDAPYTIETTAEGAVVTNLSDSTAYTQVASGTSFTYGNQTYTSNGEYLMLDPDQSVTITSTTTALAYADGVTVLTEKPSDLATKKFYAAYGSYPQTYVGEALNTTLKSASLTATGKSYTTDINGAIIVLDEYEYNGVKYAKLTSSDAYGTNYTFSTGETIADGQTYFFKVEPIVVKAMEVDANGAKVMTVDVMGSKAFRVLTEEDDMNGNYDNSWKNSDLRTYLNTTFLTESGLSGIAQAISITNEDYYGTSPDSSNTTDQIWLPSAEEIMNWTGSDWETNKDTLINDWYYSDGNDTARRRSPSDMALATYSYYYKTNDTGYYFLRSAGYGSSCVCFVYYDGHVSPNDYYNYTDPRDGFSPAFYINL